MTHSTLLLAMFEIIPLFVILIFVLVIGTILYQIIKGISQWHANNQQPVLREKLKVKDKRFTTHTHSHQTGTQGGNMVSTSHSYYITFEFSNHSRQEFRIKHKPYGLISVDDIGYLTYQGTRFKDFERIVTDDRFDYF